MPEQITPRQFQFFSILFIAIALFVIYGQILNHAWLVYGELVIVQDNEYVPNGITGKGLAWAFSNDPLENWQPLTWVSHMAVNTVAGLAAPGHHLVNVLLHLANMLLLFHILHRTTGALGASAACAALFALHPLQVESVAWAMGRREVLSTFFLLLTILAYVRYCERRTIVRYLVTFVCMGLGLLTNSILFVTPLLLILMDFWPLRRLGQQDTDTPRARVIWEKLPLLAMALPAFALTSISKELFAALSRGDLQLLLARGTNAIGAGAYGLLNILFPWGLSIHYRHLGYEIPTVRVLLSTLVLIAVTVLTVRLRKNHPYALVGWLWFLVLAFPGMYLARSGTYVMNDHFMYAGLIGIGIAGSWSVDAFLKRQEGLRRIVVPATSILIAVMVGFSYAQTRHWKHSFSLYNHALKVDPSNAMVHAGIGDLYQARRDIPRSIRHYEYATRMEARNPFLRRKLIVALLRRGRTDRAMEQLEELLVIDPNDQGARDMIESIRSSEIREAETGSTRIVEARPQQE